MPTMLVYVIKQIFMFKYLPKKIPIFPLSNFILFPNKFDFRGGNRCLEISPVSPVIKIGIVGAGGGGSRTVPPGPTRQDRKRSMGDFAPRPEQPGKNAK